jgi:hypothetical protein
VPSDSKPQPYTAAPNCRVPRFRHDRAISRGLAWSKHHQLDRLAPTNDFASAYAAAEQAPYFGIALSLAACLGNLSHHFGAI